MAKLFNGQGRRLIHATRRSAGVVLRNRWGLVAIVAGAGFVSGAAATSFADFLSLSINRLSDDLGQQAGSRWDLLWNNLDLPARDGSPVWNALRGLGVPMSVGAALAASAMLGFVIALTATVSGRARAVISSEIYRQLREDAFERCFGHSRAVEAALAEEGEAVEKATGNVTLASSLNRGADSVSSTYTYLLTCVQQLFALVSAIATSGAKMWVITVACVTIIAVQVLLSQLLARKLQARRKALDKSVNRLQSQTTELLNAREVLLAFDKADQYKARLRGLVGSVAELQASTETIESRYGALQDLIDKWGQLLLLVLIVLLAVALPHLVTAVDAVERGSAPVIFAITFYATLLAPARQLIAGYDSIRRSEAVVASFLAIFGVATETGDSGRDSGWAPFAPIVFDEVTYTPPGAEKPVLRDFSLTIPPRVTTLVLGPSGCGKTTLGRLCLGFLTPDSGALKIGDGPLVGWSLDYLHDAMSYAPQVDQILDGTIAENLKLATEGDKTSDADLERVLDMVKLKPGRPGRLAMNAQALSGGETQRLSAARLLLDRAEILVLDEPMAGVDVFTMSDIAPAIEQHWRSTGQTVLLISHKLIFASLASHIVVLGADGVVEQGSPAELLARNGVYARLQAEAVRQVGG